MKEGREPLWFQVLQVQFQIGAGSTRLAFLNCDRMVRRGEEKSFGWDCHLVFHWCSFRHLQEMQNIATIDLLAGCPRMTLEGCLTRGEQS